MSSVQYYTLLHSFPSSNFLPVYNNGHNQIRGCLDPKSPPWLEKLFTENLSEPLIVTMKPASCMHCNHCRAHHALTPHRNSEYLTILAPLHSLTQHVYISNNRTIIQVLPRDKPKLNPPQSFLSTQQRLIECPDTDTDAATHPAGAVQPCRACTHQTPITAGAATSSVTFPTFPPFPRQIQSLAISYLTNSQAVSGDASATFSREVTSRCMAGREVMA